MEVRPGYKRTEVGEIPDDWAVSTLGSHATFKTGPFGSTLHQSDYVDGGVPVINPMQIVWGKIRPTPSMAITEQAARKLSEFRLSAGNVVIGRRGEMGRCAFVRAEEHGWLCGTGSMIIRTGPSLDARFIQRALSSPPVIAAIESTSVGSTMINLNQGTLSELRIALPPTKAEQEAIAEALSEVDALSESLEQLIIKKRQLKEGAMQELLASKRRLPGFSGEWKTLSLGEMGKCYRGVSYNPDLDLSPFDSATTVRLLRSNNVQSARIVFSDMQFVDSRRVSPAQRLQRHDILICMANGSRELVGKAGRFMADDDFPYTFGAFMGCFRPDGQTTDPEFVFYLFQAERYRVQIAVLLAGSSINNLTPSGVEALSMHVPPARLEQSAIVAVVNDLELEIVTLEDKLAKARQIKQGMMQELLTGRIRLV